MRRFLYLSPYFPPLTQVGALRPLKFARHLPAHGWAPVVLCDLWSGAKTDTNLLAAVPATTTVVRRWSRRAEPAWRSLRHEAPVERSRGRVRSPPEPPPSRLRALLPPWLDNPELVPLGEHGPRMAWNLKVARQTLAQHPCEAIVVNADPYAACLVGARLAKESGLPLILDFRDPWAPCELRRPRRPAPVRALIDRLERQVIDRAAAVILNTETARQDYIRHYPDLPADRFHCIRNHFDRALISAGQHPGFDRFSLLFLGNFGRFIQADVLLRTLAELRRRGVPSQTLQLVVTGRFTAESWQLAKGLGVQDMLHLHAHVPYGQIGAVMQAADALVLLIQPRGRQRFAAKFFDYLASDRPILAVSDNPELDALLQRTQAGVALPYGDVGALADAVHRLWRAAQTDASAQVGESGEAGEDAAHTQRSPQVEALSSERSSGQLAEILAAVTAHPAIGDQH